MAAIKCEHGRLRWRCVECGGHEGTFDALQSRSLCSHEPPAVPAAFDVVLHAANVAARARCGERVKSYLVMPSDTLPDDFNWEGELLLDPEGDLEHRYGAAAECLYLIRPDLYVGYRDQPADADRLLAYFDRVFAE